MNALQEALLGKGLATKEMLPPEQPHLSLGLVGVGSTEKEAQVRLYLTPDRRRHPVTPAELEIVRHHLEGLGYSLGLGLDVECVIDIIPAWPDKRVWIQINCHDSLMAGAVLEQLRIDPPPGLDFTRITTPGIQA